MNTESHPTSIVTIEDFGVFLDLRDQGYGDVIGGSLFAEDNGDLSFRFGHSLISDYTEDDWVGTHAHVVRSTDDGKTWGPMFMTDFPDSMSRVYAGRLPDGRFYLIGNSFPKLLDRMHLMISISEDGAKFSKMYTLVDHPTAQRVKGTLKVHGHAYPCGLVDGDRLLVGYSVNKEDIECGIVELADL